MKFGIVGSGMIAKLQAKAIEAIRTLDPSIVVSGNGDTIRLAYSDQELSRRKKEVIDQSIEILRRRVDETGTLEPTIVRQGDFIADLFQAALDLIALHGIFIETMGARNCHPAQTRRTGQVRARRAPSCIHGQEAHTSALPHPWQRHLHLQARLGIGNVQPTAVGLGHQAAQIQAQAHAPSGALARRVGPK